MKTKRRKLEFACFSHGKAYIFVQSAYDGSWFKAYPNDRPNKLIGTFDRLPKYAQKQIQKQQKAEAS